MAGGGLWLGLAGGECGWLGLGVGGWCGGGGVGWFAGAGAVCGCRFCISSMIGLQNGFIWVHLELMLHSRLSCFASGDDAYERCGSQGLNHSLL